MNKKIKLISLSIASVAVATATVLPLVLSSSSAGSHEQGQQSTVQEMTLPDGTKQTVTLYDPENDGRFFNIDNARNFSAEKREGQVAEGWTSDYTMPDWDSKFDLDYEYDYALKYGWTMDKYQQYLQRHYDMKGEAYNKFGVGTLDVGVWIGYNGNYGAWSEASPWTWDNAWQVPENHIDNNLRWYVYDRNDLVFLWDQNNLENAWKRLINLDRLVPTTKNEIRTDDAVDGVGRNYAMVDGQLVPVSSLKPDGQYYYVKDEGDKYVLDDHGWKVIVEEPTDFSATTGGGATGANIFNTVINPKDANDVPNLTDPASFTQYNVYASTTIPYPADYNINQPMRDEVLSTVNDSPCKDVWNATGTGQARGVGGYNKNYRYQLRGKYTIAATEDSYQDLVARPDVWLPQEDTMDRWGGKPQHDLTGYINYDPEVPNSSGYISMYNEAQHMLDPDTRNYEGYNEDTVTSSGVTQKILNPQWSAGANWAARPGVKEDRFGYGQMKWELYGPECGYAWAWVEDGKGGHKIWKSINNSIRMLRKDRNDKTTPDNEIRFWGNYNYVYEDGETFRNSLNSKNI